MIYYPRYYDMEGNFLWEGGPQQLWAVNATFNHEGKRYRVRSVAVAKYLEGLADNIQIVNIVETDPDSRLNILLTKATPVEGDRNTGLTLMEDAEVLELRELLKAAEKDTDDKLRLLLLQLYGGAIIDLEIKERKLNV